MNAIEIKKLTKNYGKSRGITELDLVVKEGDIFGFIGPNGAGKSTTIRTLLGLIRPTSGEAKVLGYDIRDAQTSILRETGYLPSEINFYPGMKVSEVIRYSANLRKASCEDRAKVLCERLGVEVNKKVDDLSLGNRKKVGIVTALQHSPRLLILDEPTSGLDPLVQREFFDILKEENARGATVFLSSHVLSEVQNHCRTAAFIRDGRILMHDEVKNLEAAGAKQVTIKGTIDASVIAGASDVERHGDRVTFLYQGDAANLLAALGAQASGVDDIHITEPSLEDIFMKFYEGADSAFRAENKEGGEAK
ncbi:MAG: ABC transporter ATP-binding protein [Clostridiales bacterium]|nr:ABC transporter ATP-binding protein [Clostridiales bacterium]